MPPTDKVVDPEDAETLRKSVCPRISLVPVRYTKTIHFVRHGQGFHNVAGHINHDNYKLWDYADAHLTELGWEQATQLGRHVAAVKLPVDLVVVAPLQRALETAVAAFGSKEQNHPHNGDNDNGNGDSRDAAGATADGGEDSAPLLMVAQEGLAGKRTAHTAISSRGCPPFIAHELCREHIGVHPCDRRSPVSEYKKRFPAVDFSLVDPDEDALWTPNHRETKDEIRRRGLAFLKWLATRPERNIAVVSHSSFLHFTLSCFGQGAAEAVQGEMHKWYDNCEMRSLVLSDDSAEAAEAAAAGGARPVDQWHFAGGLHATGLPH
ncbi:hypothetical protein VOLCADRAFT_57872 [Volvox carteri f. nagariensis]|uniref:Phosphoglycerate mutase-like protein n=1 Tax=Volvox carteri f. nagariensis TaxID=3068 RepID=D8TNX7_VOLCA|nr:uncharacterized protein VOLCADRAFT_57872 [Volvox carteri f. nagariensis]EFJ50919.1 hypothetical protein VOLCADRAFT_57872 [Volvox carteri f. nagariensis]|eukprot:XP_002947931.1 hypothetical protein VOLCADRAFT_57872 [Volvox carteri f. nagariensis]